MKKYINTFLVFVLIFSFALSPFPNSSTAEADWVTSQTITSADVPAWVYIPSIHLFSSVQGVGIDHKGNMDVPPGNTNDVGWYKYGVLPGDEGTAVLDAHNTAAFKNLHTVAPGESIYIMTTRGRILVFEVTEAETHSMATLSPHTLFEDTDFKQLNLITCAGTLLGNGEATHRLIVSAKLAQDNTVSSSVSS